MKFGATAMKINGLKYEEVCGIENLEELEKEIENGV